MSKQSRAQVFQGTTRKQTRDYLLSAFAELRDRYERLIVPCCGRFTVPQVARAAGWPPEAIVASDISLFSSLIGYHCAGMDLAPLGMTFGGELARLQEHPDPAAAALYAMKVAQFGQSQTYYARAHRDEFLRAPELYIGRFAEKLAALKAALGPVVYRTADLFAEMGEVEFDPHAALYMNPPAYRRGYEKMFDFGDTLTWDAPNIPQFDPATGDGVIFDFARRTDALVMWYRRRQVSDEERPFVVFGHEQKAQDVDFTLCNRPAEVALQVARRRPEALKHSGIPALPYDYEIGPDSRIVIAPTSKQVALYYRDLWAHKLGVTRSERYFLLMLDGFVFGAVGMHSSNALRRDAVDGRYQVNETFGFTVPTQYARLGRLLMHLITTRQFLQVLIDGTPLLGYLRPLEFQTTCIADVPEMKTHRGLSKLRERRRLPNGKYYLNYVAQFRDETYSEVLAKWLDGHAKLKP